MAVCFRITARAREKGFGERPVQKRCSNPQKTNHKWPIETENDATSPAISREAMDRTAEIKTRTDVGSWPRSEATRLSPCCRALGKGKLAEVRGQPASHVSSLEPELPHPGLCPQGHLPTPPEPKHGRLG